MEDPVMFSSEFLDQMADVVADKVIARMSAQNGPQRRLMTVKEGGEYIGKTEDAMRLMIHRGEIKYPAIKRIGARVFVDLRELDKWVDNL